MLFSYYEFSLLVKSLKIFKRKIKKKKYFKSNNIVYDIDFIEYTYYIYC